MGAPLPVIVTSRDTMPLRSAVSLMLDTMPVPARPSTTPLPLPSSPTKIRTDAPLMRLWSSTFCCCVELLSRLKVAETVHDLLPLMN